MSNWLNIRSQRLLLAGALSITVGIPTLACTGGGQAVESPSSRIQGTWKIQPNEADLRNLKILDFALNKPTKLDQLKKKLKPKMTSSELEMFNAVSKAPKNSPEIKMAKAQMAIMKSARLTITSSNYSLNLGGNTDEWQYEISKETGKQLTLKLDNGEVHNLTFETDNLINVVITKPERLELRFKRE